MKNFKNYLAIVQRLEFEIVVGKQEDHVDF
jgi:hypothetical protein